MPDLSPEQWISFIGLLVFGGLVIRWLLDHIKDLNAVIDKKDEQLTNEREYSRKLAAAYSDNTRQIVSAQQEVAATTERLKDSVDEARRTVEKCRGPVRHEIA